MEGIGALSARGRAGWMNVEASKGAGARKVVDGGVFTGEGEFGIIYSRFRVRSGISETHRRWGCENWRRCRGGSC